VELKDKRAFVSGGTRGIGAAIALDLARHGCHVAINGRYSDEEAARVHQQAEQAGVNASLVIADVARQADAERAVGDAARTLRGLDIRQAGRLHDGGLAQRL
jgi:NAD(P)-dependent dehydrogenase (short-subunit alcohol dehydrogenase family)